MPISNLAIQRRRLNELKRLGYKAEPTDFNEFRKFSFTVDSLTTHDCARLNQMEFYIEYAYGDKNGISLIVAKEPEEKRQPFLRKQIAEAMK